MTTSTTAPLRGHKMCHDYDQMHPCTCTCLTIYAVKLQNDY